MTGSPVVDGTADAQSAYYNGSVYATRDDEILTSRVTNQCTWFLDGAWGGVTSGFIFGNVSPGGAGYNAGIYVNGSAGWGFFIRNASGAVVNIQVNGTAAVGEFSRVIGTYDGANLRLYKNGALIGGPTAQSGNVNASSGTDITICRWLGQSARAYVRSGHVWNRALTLDEIIEVTRRPEQMYRGRPRRVFLPAAGGGGSTSDGYLESDGTGSLTASGASLASGAVSVSGAGSTTSVGASLASGDLSGAGAGAATFGGASQTAGFESGDIDAAGTGVASSVGASLASGVFSATGTGTATFAGDSQTAGVEDADLSADGQGAATLGGAAVAAGAFTMSGISSAEFRGSTAETAATTVYEGRRPKRNVVAENNRRMKQWAFGALNVIQRQQ